MAGDEYLPVPNGDPSSSHRHKPRRTTRYQQIRSIVILLLGRLSSLQRKQKWLLFFGAIAATIIFMIPTLRHDYIKTFPKKSIQDLQDPHWWIDPWTLPASRFPKMSLYPDPDWNPTPVWLSHPVEELRNHPSPSTFPCDDHTHPFYPTAGSTSPSFSGATTSSPLLFLGIFSAANKTEVRNLIRKRQLPHYKGTKDVDSILGRNETYPKHSFGDMGIPPGMLEAKFILGYPPRWSHTMAMFQDGTLKSSDPDLEAFALAIPKQLGGSSESIVNWSGNGVVWWRKWLPVPWTQGEINAAKEHLRLMQSVAEEDGVFGDIEVLPLEDSIVQGKTYHYFRWLAKTRVNNRPPRFAMKTDDDTFHVIPNLLSIFTSLSCSSSYYIGNSWGCSQPFPFHFGGLGYALSWPMISWLGWGSELPRRHTNQNEDARLGSYFTSLDHLKDPLITVDYSILMGSWFDDMTFPKSTDTIAVHYLKLVEKYKEQSQRMWDIWKTNHKEWKLPNAGRDWVQRHSR